MEDKLLISVLRGNSGDEGEGDLLLNIPVNVSRTEDDCGVEGGGERGSEIAASKRETELVEEAERLEMVDDRARFSSCLALPPALGDARRGKLE